MDLRTWFVEATTGNVVAPATLLDGSRATSMIGGGTLNASVSLAGYRRTDGRPDTDVCQLIQDYCSGGRHTILLTDGADVRGEWLIWGMSLDHDESAITVEGFEWDAYPQYRSNHRTYRYKNTDMGEILAAALDEAFNSFQPADATPVTVPVPVAGTKLTLDIPVRTSYYGDIIDDLDDMGILEWRVIPTVSWSNGVPVKVTREVAYARPRFQAEHPDRLVKYAPNTRGDNIVSFKRSRTYSKIANSVYGWGAGKGGKQRFATAQDFGFTGRGYLAITKNVNYQGEYNNTQLLLKTTEELRASQDPWETTQVVVDTREMTGVPTIGAVHWMDIAATFTFPAGYQGKMRVGQIDWQIGTPLVGLELEEV